MDIGDERKGNALPDGLQGFRRPLVGNGQPDDLAARSLQTLNLGDRPVDLMGQRLGHRLDNDRGPSAAWHVADHNLLRASPWISHWSRHFSHGQLSSPGRKFARRRSVDDPFLPWDKALPAVGHPLDDIVEDDKDDKEDEDDKAHLHPDLPDLGAEIAPEKGLEAEDKYLAAVNHRERKEVDDSELETDQTDPAEHGKKTHFPGRIGQAGDLQRPAES